MGPQHHYAGMIKDAFDDVVETPGFDDMESSGRWSTPTMVAAPWYRRAVARLREAFELADLLVFAGLVMLGVGFHGLYAPLGWIVPGAVLVWHQLPQRERFFPARPVARPDIQASVLGRASDGRAQS